jgi:hypothetical protein
MTNVVQIQRKYISLWAQPFCFVESHGRPHWTRWTLRTPRYYDQKGGRAWVKFRKKAGRFSTLQLVRLMYGASQTHKSWVTTSLFRTSSLLEKTGEDIDLHGTIVLDCMCTAQSTQCNGPSPLTIINRGGNLLAPHDSIRFDSDYEVNDSKTIIDAYWLQQFFLCKFPCLIWVCY